MKRTFLGVALVVLLAGLGGSSDCRAQGAYLELGMVKKYAKTAVVGPVGSPGENGGILLEALADISDADLDNPYLVKLEPGVYHVADTSIEMKPYVDIEGSGTGTTRVEGEIGAYDRGVVIGADNAEMRFLSIENLGGVATADSTGVYCDGASPKLSHVSIIARNGNNSCHAVFCCSSSAPRLENVRLEAHDATNYVIGLYAHSSEPSIRNSEIWVNGGGSYHFGVEAEQSSVVRVNDVDIEAEGNSAHGVFNETDSTVDIRNSYIRGTYAVLISSATSVGGGIWIESSIVMGTANSVRNDNSVAAFFVGASRIEGGTVLGAVTCAHVHNGDYVELDSLCGIPGP